MSKTNLPEDDANPIEDFDETLRELDQEESRIVIRLEMRKFRKPVTVIEGMPGSEKQLEQTARSLKHSLATGGTAKDGLILLQVDNRDGVRNQLIKLGYPEKTIEVQ